MIKKNKKILLLSLTVVSAVFCILACVNDKSKKEETASVTFYVDETLLPVFEDQESVFESKGTDKINLVAKSENEIVSLFHDDSTRLGVLARKLTDGEQLIFTEKNITPKLTPIAVDGIALIVNKKSKDSIVDLQHIIDFMNGKEVASIKALVFDNPNSSTINYMNKLASVKTGDNKKIFALKTNNDVIKYISENEGYIGVIGVNWLTQPMPDMLKYTSDVKVLAVKDVKNSSNTNNYYKPSQANLAEGLYPLRRIIYMLNYEGSMGLGTSFASFVGGNIGQQIILKSGLAPARIELREIKVRKDIEN